MGNPTHTSRACIAQEGVSCALATLYAIGGAGLFDALPQDRSDQLRHEHGTWLLAMLTDQLQAVQQKIDAADDTPVLATNSEG